MLNSQRSGSPHDRTDDRQRNLPDRASSARIRKLNYPSALMHTRCSAPFFAAYGPRTRVLMLSETRSPCESASNFGSSALLVQPDGTPGSEALARMGICAAAGRGRSGAYADGVRSGVPEAVQVADRWHLLVNCSDTLRQLLDRHQRQLRRAAHICAVGERVPAQVPPRARVPTPADRRKSGCQERRRARFQAAAELHRNGTLFRCIARQPGMAPRAGPECPRPAPW